MDAELIRSYLAQTQILRAPKRRLSTFGATQINYHLVSPVEDLSNRTRLRHGTVVSLKPQILTAESFLERFEGFGDEAKEFSDWLKGSYKDLLRSLEYNFKNQGFTTRVLSERPETVLERITSELDAKDEPMQALIRCPDAAWSLALMKFALDESARSFPTHVQDLERRGLFDAGSAQDERRRREIERLFEAARSDKAAVEELGRKLREYGLFAEYEDRFLGLF